MVTMATTARGRLRPPLMPGPAMDMVMDTAMVTDMDMAMEATDTDMAMDTTAIMARGRLRLLPLLSPAMDMVMDMAMDMVTAMDMAMATTDKFLLFNAVESSVQTKNLDHLVL